MPVLGLRARRLLPLGLVWTSEAQPALSMACWAVRPAQTVSRPLAGIPVTVCVAPAVLVRVRPMGRETKST